ncbi:MAG TPA: HEAT repeat domain-containing protein, partial [Isosphaeraceae bacterium]|nr:HEAT repeat domain-containing protein [Isosphaeraceae bacterium]
MHATASRALDTCLRGARGLALLGDPRAFGLLLQLSREEDKTARAAVCRAMAALDDRRAVERLRSMLHDKEAEVRDAAFTAIVRINQADPLLAAESGLNASHEDVRRRGLQVLVDLLRKTPAEAALDLLTRALNDSFPGIRAEAFKSVLSLPAIGAGARALRFAMRSVHADVRREVLNEAMAQVGEPWGWDLLLEFFNDPDPALRGDAFAFALKKTRGLEFLESALASRYADLRKRAVDELVKKHTAAAQALLVRALDDEDRDVRLAALESLVDGDAVSALAQALGSPHPDVRLRAAKAFARHGDPRALAPLLALATAPEPAEAERRDDWLKLAESALDGLGELGDTAALPHLIPILDSPHEALRKQAARALVWVSRPDAIDALRQALQHADPQVKYQAAKGLAYAGDPSVASLVFSDGAGKVLSVGERIAAALALGAAGEDRLILSLDDTRDEVRSRALLLMMMREWKDPQGNAARCLACLSSRTPRLRLTAAQALEALSEPGAFEVFVVGLVNDQGDKPAWKIPVSTVDALADLLVHGAPQLQARTARLLRHLNAKEQAAFDQAWAVHQARFDRELAELRGRARERKPVPIQSTPAQLRELAFGAYVGLVREQGGSTGKKGQTAGAGTDPQEVSRVRQTALNRLRALAGSDPHFAAAARPVFVQALGDPNQVVRLLAFEHARALGIEATELAAEALATGHTDLGVKGLELLTGGTSEAEGAAVLERAMLTRKDDLAIEAAKLLAARRGFVAVAGRALEAAHEPLRIQAVHWLA